MTISDWPWACPICRTPLRQQTPDLLQCPADGISFPRKNGIWRFLTPDQQAYYASFVAEYDIVRSGEQWGSDRAAYYRALPFKDLSGQHPDIWRIRATTYRTFLKRVLHPFAARRAQPLRIVDAGAGNGWLANRLGQEGHQVLATDLRSDQADGLGAHIWYEGEPFTAVQTPFETIPLSNASVDLVVFAGSFHYATDYSGTLGEAQRVLHETGKIVILESPVYCQAASGEQMVRELKQRLQRQHGVTAETLEHRNYLTRKSLHEIGQQLQLEWETITPFYGWGWFLSPLLARLKGQREPARFHIFVATSRKSPRN